MEISVDRAVGKPVTVEIADSKTGQRKYIHPDIAGTEAQGHGKEEADGVGVEDDLEGAVEKQRKNGPKTVRRESIGLKDPLRAQQWTRHVVEQQARLNHQVRLHGAKSPSRHRPQSARESIRNEDDAGRPQNPRARSAGRVRQLEAGLALHERQDMRSRERRGSGSESPGKPRWLVPGRTLSDRERLTRNESRYRDYTAFPDIPPCCTSERYHSCTRLHSNFTYFAQVSAISGRDAQTGGKSTKAMFRGYA